jgi:hypothetical protein
MLTAKCHRANRELEGKSRGFPHLAKNQRDMGHPSSVVNARETDGAFFPQPVKLCPSIRGSTKALPTPLRH